MSPRQRTRTNTRPRTRPRTLAPSAGEAASPPTEVELKLAVRPADLPRLRRALNPLGRAQRMQLETIYLDTPDRALAARGLALRLRRAGSTWVQTLKGADMQTARTAPGEGSALSARAEWETAVPHGRLQLDQLGCDAATARWLASQAAQLSPAFRTRFVRSTWQTELGGARIEVALDLGEIRVPRQAARAAARAALLELELEFKGSTAGTAGADEAARQRAACISLLDLAQRLAAGTRGAPLALLPLGSSKAARGHRLASGTIPVPIKASAAAFAADLQRTDSATQTLARVIDRGVSIVLANLEGLSAAHAAARRASGAPVDPEFVHQARVALRRMRSAIRLLRAVAPLPVDLVPPLRTLAQALGGVRDWDVIAAELLPPLVAAAREAGILSAADATRLARAVVRRQSAARAALQRVIDAPATALGLLGAMRWAQGALDAGGRPLSAQADALLAQAARRLRRAARGFARQAPAARHRVRIVAKRLRYALDLLGPHLAAAGRARYGRALAALQDEMGAMNDATVLRRHLPELTRKAALLRWADVWLAEREAAAVAASRVRLARLKRMRLPARG
jgi:triphosphatase